jgi:hypothetical protein
MLARVSDLFGMVHPSVWVMTCLALSLLYVRIWPRQKAVGLGRGARFLVLRWFHALVWLLLAIAVGVHATSGNTAYWAASAIALLALAVYVVFVVVSFTTRPAQSGGNAGVK